MCFGSSFGRVYANGVSISVRLWRAPLPAAPAGLVGAGVRVAVTIDQVPFTLSLFPVCIARSRGLATTRGRTARAMVLYGRLLVVAHRLPVVRDLPLALVRLVVVKVQIAVVVRELLPPAGRSGSRALCFLRKRFEATRRLLPLAVPDDGSTKLGGPRRRDGAQKRGLGRGGGARQAGLRGK